MIVSDHPCRLDWLCHGHIHGTLIPREEGVPTRRRSAIQHYHHRFVWISTVWRRPSRCSVRRLATLQAGNKQLAFMQGIQDKNIQIKGNPALVMWFQGLMKYLKPKKKR